MMVLKKKEIIAGALVLLIGVAGYLNWSYQDTIKVTDGASYVETGKKLGEAQYVNAPANSVVEPSPTSDPNYFTNAKMNKENARSKSLDILKQTVANESFDAEIRKKAQDQILQTSTNIEKETAMENIAKSKGYNEFFAYIDIDNVNIAVRKASFSSNDVEILKGIATEQLKIPAKNIKIVEIK